MRPEVDAASVSSNPSETDVAATIVGRIFRANVRVVKPNQPSDGDRSNAVELLCELTSPSIESTQDQ